MQLNCLELAIIKEALENLLALTVKPYSKKDEEMHYLILATLKNTIRRIDEEQNTSFIKDLREEAKDD